MKKYNSYKNSGIEWIGEIPNHWEVNRVKYSFSFKTGFTPPSGKREYYQDGNHIWINISDLQDKYVCNSASKITDEAIQDLEPEIVPKGSLLYSFKLSVGRVGFNSVDCYTNEAIFSIVPDGKTNLNFFYYSLPDQIIKNAHENIYGAKILNQELIKNASLIIPPPEEQTTIADYLDRKTAAIDDLIENKKRLLQLYEEEKQAVIDELVTGKKVWNGKEWTQPQEIKDSRIEWLREIPKDWEICKLKNLVLKIGSGVTPSGGSNVYKTSGIPLLRSQNIHFNGLKLDDVAYISREVHESMNNSKVFAGDILLNITGASIGRVYFADEDLGEANVNQHVCIIRPDEKIKTTFIYYALISTVGKEQINLSQTGSGREGITFESLKNFHIPFLSVENQNLIVDQLNSINHKINNKINKTIQLIELLQEYRQALISEVVTGKVKVTD